ncbi:MAG: lysophospholipid acyltransferase family protein [Victivallaceae bacterium]
MRFLRMVWRITLLIGWFGVCSLLAVPWKIRGKARGIRHNLAVTRLWARGVCRILNIHLKVIGDPDSFEGGMIVSNHQGYADILICASVFPLRFAPKVQIRSWPFLGWFVSLNFPVWIDRESRAKAAEVATELEWTLQEKLSMLVYPEGTSTDGGELLPFKSTPFEPVVKLQLPVLPILIRYIETPDRYPIAWYGDFTFLPHVGSFISRKRIDAMLEILPPVRPEPGESRKELANRIHDNMDKAYRRS